jgi:hypothetical protein
LIKNAPVDSVLLQKINEKFGNEKFHTVEKTLSSCLTTKKRNYTLLELQVQKLEFFKIFQMELVVGLKWA